MSKCYDNTDYDNLGSDIQNTWEQHKPEQHVEIINDNIEEFDKAMKLFEIETTIEEYFLDNIKNVLQFGNDIQAIRFMEKYYEAKKEQDEK